MITEWKPDKSLVVRNLSDLFVVGLTNPICYILLDGLITGWWLQLSDFQIFGNFVMQQFFPETEVIYTEFWKRKQIFSQM